MTTSIVSPSSISSVLGVSSGATRLPSYMNRTVAGSLPAGISEARSALPTLSLGVGVHELFQLCVALCTSEMQRKSKLTFCERYARPSSATHDLEEGLARMSFEGVTIQQRTSAPDASVTLIWRGISIGVRGANGAKLVAMAHSRSIRSTSEGPPCLAGLLESSADCLVGARRRAGVSMSACQ